MDRQDNSLVGLVKVAQDALAAGDLDSALAAFANAVEHYPDQPESHNNLGAFYMGIGPVRALPRPASAAAVELAAGERQPAVQPRRDAHAPRPARRVRWSISRPSWPRRLTTRKRTITWRSPSS